MRPSTQNSLKIIRGLIFETFTSELGNSQATQWLIIFLGLLMLIGVILYISIFKSEVGSKLKPKSMLLEEAAFTYRYGYSFLLYVFGILLVFCTGILNVFLYTSFHNEPTLAVRPKNSPCFSYCKVAASKSSSISSPVHRYVLRKDPNCNVHASNLEKSLNQLYTEPGPAVAPFEFPITVLTRSVSTLTDDDSLSPRRKATLMCGIEKKGKTKVQAKKPKDIYYIESSSVDDDLSNVFVIEPIESFHRRRRSSWYGGEHRRVSNHSLSDLDKVLATDFSNFDLPQFFAEKCGTKNFNSRTLPRNFARSTDDRRVSASGIFMQNEWVDIFFSKCQLTA